MADETESEVRACSATYSRTWFVTLKERSCKDVEGDRGTWVAEPVDASISDSICTMRWEGERYSRADIDALRQSITDWQETMTPACSSAIHDHGTVTAIPGFDFVAQIGANGCDVCGRLGHDGRIIVVLPPERTRLREFQVDLSNGQVQTYKINASNAARVMQLQLPAPPAGAQYKAGPIHIE